MLNNIETKPGDIKVYAGDELYMIIHGPETKIDLPPPSDEELTRLSDIETKIDNEIERMAENGESLDNCYINVGGREYWALKYSANYIEEWLPQEEGRIPSFKTFYIKGQYKIPIAMRPFQTFFDIGPRYNDFKNRN